MSGLLTSSSSHSWRHETFGWTGHKEWVVGKTWAPPTLCLETANRRVKNVYNIASVWGRLFAVQTRLASKSLEQSPLGTNKYSAILRNSPRITEPEGSLPCSQKPDNGLYLVSDEASPKNPTLLTTSILILSSHRRLSDLFLIFLATLRVHVFFFFFFF